MQNISTVNYKRTHDTNVDLNDFFSSARKLKGKLDISDAAELLKNVAKQILDDDADLVIEYMQSLQCISAYTQMNDCRVAYL